MLESKVSNKEKGSSSEVQLIQKHLPTVYESKPTGEALRVTVVFQLILVVLQSRYHDEAIINQSCQNLPKPYKKSEDGSYKELLAMYEELQQQNNALIEKQKQLLENQEKFQLVLETTKEDIHDREDWKPLSHLEDQEVTIAIMRDPLTNLWNRIALYDKVAPLLASQEIRNFAMLFLDVDNFKFINETFGHILGDHLIRSLSERFQTLLGKNSSLYRNGGDEFIIIVKEFETREVVETYANKILTSLKEPFYIGNRMIYVNMSIGVSIYPEHGSDINELLRCADIAMYRAKEAGGSRYTVYSAFMKDSIIERVRLEMYLRIALDHEEFEMHYQPQFDLIENKITGLEALLRWNSQELGPVSPIKFIEVAEETQLIIPLGSWVMKEACKFAKKLQDKGITDITVSVNISILQILQDNFVDYILETLAFYHVNPSCLELEITETILMKSYKVISNKLSLLCEHGLKIVLDDFGKGYSSLCYLEQLPITTLKIDKSFIDYISIEQKNTSLTGQIIMLGKNMGLSVVAEGVETEKQLKYLIVNKCQKIQGYLFSKPLPEQTIWGLITGKLYGME